MRLDPTEHLPAPSDPPVTAHVAGRASTVHDDDAAWFARMKARENPKLPQDVDNKALAEAERNYAEAVRKRRLTADALTLAAQADADSMEELLLAREAYHRTERAWRATRTRARQSAETDQVKKP